MFDKAERKEDPDCSRAGFTSSRGEGDSRGMEGGRRHLGARPARESHSDHKTALLIGVLIGLLAAILVTSVLLIRRYQMTQETIRHNTMVARYERLLQDAEARSLTDPENALLLLSEAIDIFPERAEAYRSYAYTLYSSGNYNECVSSLSSIADQLGDPTIDSILASCYFELGRYEEAADLFQRASVSQGDSLSADSLRDYAVCLGQLGDLDGAHEVLAQLEESGYDSPTVDYILGEINFAERNFSDAEACFLRVLDDAADPELLRKSFCSLARVYHESGENRKLVELGGQIDSYADIPGIQDDPNLYELIGAARYELAGEENDNSLYILAAQAFLRAMELGRQEQYLYENTCFCYIEANQLDEAEAILREMESVFPDSHSPHTLRTLVLITGQEDLPEEKRDYSEALEEYEKAESLITARDDTTYYLKVGTLVDQIRQGGWLGDDK